jgi:hypothetical protein
MAFKPLKNRIDDLPLVICGPVLRSVNDDSVTVWIVLRKERNVRLSVFIREENDSMTEKFSNAGKTIQVGENFHVAVITAKASEKMRVDQLYFYNLFFDDGAVPNHNSENLTTGNEKIIDFKIFYDFPESTGADNPSAGIVHPQLPSFSLPPDDLNKLRIVHGSCRKPNAESLDAMPSIDNIIGSDWTRPSARPHFLFLTGDQIYADDVSPVLLYMLMDAGSALFGNNEEKFFKMDETVEKEDKIEIEKSDKDRKYISLVNGKPSWNGKEPAPHLRGRTVYHFAGFSEKFKNHLMTFGEYCAMYLFVWSNVLWDKELPEIEDVFEEYLLAASSDNTDPRPPDIDAVYKKDHKRLLKFVSTLPKVRRALANVPVYMIFDDHEVTDDWHMTLEWCKDVFSNKLGKRIIQNGMLAYTLFQAWGNTPEHFEDPDKKKPGFKILKILQKWDASTGYFVSNEAEISGPLGLPSLISAEIEFLFKTVPGHKKLMLQTIDETKIIKWHYSVTGKNFEIFVLDGRTKRGYPDPGKNAGSGKIDLDRLHADIIHESVFGEQIPASPESKAVTFIVAPTSILSIPAIDLNEFPLLSRLIAKAATKNDRTVDFYDHWKNQSAAFEKLLNHIAKRGKIADAKTETRNIILTGDVHFSAASRLIYEKKPPSPDNNDPHCQSIFAQLVASSFKKQEKKTRLIHHQGYKFSDPAGFVQMKVFLEDIPDKAGDFIYKIYVPAFSELLLVFLYILGISLHAFFFILEKIWKILDVIDPFDLFEPKLPKPRQFLGWQDPAAFGNVKELKLKIPGPDPNTPRFKNRLLTTPTVLSKSDAEKVANLTLPEPHWRYRIDYILAENETRIDHVNPPAGIGNPAVTSKNKALEEYLKASKNHLDYAQKHGSGKEIVGLNNVSEVSFNWNENGKKSVIQQTWWHLKPKDNKEPEFFPLTRFKVSLDFDENELPHLN